MSSTWPFFICHFAKPLVPAASPNRYHSQRKSPLPSQLPSFRCGERGAERPEECAERAENYTGLKLYRVHNGTEFVLSVWRKVDAALYAEDPNKASPGYDERPLIFHTLRIPIGIRSSDSIHCKMPRLFLVHKAITSDASPLLLLKKGK